MNEKEFCTWKKNIYTALKDISDLETQKLSWAGKLPNIVSSFSEVINVLYDFNFEHYIEYLKESGNQKLLANKMTELDNAINQYLKNEKSDIEILEDEKWRLITEKANKIVDDWDSV